MFFSHASPSTPRESFIAGILSPSSGKSERRAYLPRQNHLLVSPLLFRSKTRAIISLNYRERDFLLLSHEPVRENAKKCSPSRKSLIRRS